MITGEVRMLRDLLHELGVQEIKHNNPNDRDKFEKSPRNTLTSNKITTPTTTILSNFESCSERDD